MLRSGANGAAAGIEELLEGSLAGGPSLFFWAYEAAERTNLFSVNSHLMLHCVAVSFP